MTTILTPTYFLLFINSLSCDYKYSKMEDILILFVTTLALVIAVELPFRNTSLPWHDRVNDLINRLTIEEIMVQMSRGGSGPHGGPAPAIPRLKIDPWSWNTECLRGDGDSGNATAFPQALGLAATWRYVSDT